MKLRKSRKKMKRTSKDGIICPFGVRFNILPAPLSLLNIKV